ncbi:MAG: hypothetical protein ACOX4L_09200 [Bacillota bacterium]|jgi:hypothetical protein
MPRINRVRVTNIQYDNGKKYLPDLLFEVRGLDALLILANGGGKSLLIQLILQVILPNTKMGKRKVEDLLRAAPYTGHVAVEWLLDGSGERHQFLCTGFCYSGGHNSDQTIRYYNYLFDYDDQSELTIENLPLSFTAENESVKRPMSYQKLKDWLREKGIQPLDKPETYQERLKIYHILPEEWKNIRETNGAEGGVDKFFEKSRTTMQLMDNLLIPSVEGMIFQDEEKKQELLHAFTQHREMLLEIPVIKQNLQDFALIRNAAEGVVEEVQALAQVQRKFDVKTREIVNWAHSFLAFNKDAKQALEKLGREQEEYSAKGEELNWQEESYKWFLRKLELSDAEEAVKKAETAFNQIQTKLSQAQEQENRLQALYYFTEAEQADQDAFGYQRALEFMEQAEPELLMLLSEKKQILKSAWTLRQAELHREREKKNQELTDLNTEKETLTNEQRDIKIKQQDFTKKQAVVENWLANCEKVRQDLLSFVETREVLEPGAALETRREHLLRIGEQEKEVISKREKLNNQVEELGQDILNFSEDKQRAELETDSIKEKLHVFREETEALRGMLAAQGIYLKNIFAEKDTAIMRVKDALENHQGKRLGLQAELANLQEKWALVEGRDYYVPHHDLLRIKSRLEKVGIYTVLGSEWLAGQPISEEKREAVLKRQPLLPYAIIIEAHQVHTVKYIMGQGTSWTCDLPLLFLVKSADMLSMDEAGGNIENFFPLWQDDIYLFQPDSFHVYISGDAFQVFKSRLHDQIKAKEEEVTAEAGREQIFLSIQENLAHFFRQYPEEQVNYWWRTKEDMLLKVKDLEDQIQKLEEDRVGLKEEITGLESSLQEMSREKEKLKNVIEKITAFHELSLLYPAKEILLKEITTKLDKVNLRLEEIEKRLMAIAGEEVQKKNELKEMGKLLKTHEEDFTRYRLGEINGGLTSPCDYNSAKIEVDDIIIQFNAKQQERSNIEKLLATAEQRSKTAKFEIEKTGVEMAWLRENQHPVSQEEIIAAGQLIKEFKSHWEEAQKVLENTQVHYRTTQNTVAHLADSIRERFEQDPYEGFTSETHELAIISIKEQKREIENLLARISQEITKQTVWQGETWDAYEFAEETMMEEMRHMGLEVTLYTYQEWELLKVKPRRLLAGLEKERSECAVKIENQKSVVQRHFENYLKKLEITKNVKVRQFIRDVRAIMADNRLYDYDFVQDQFLRIFEGLDRYETQYKNTLVECEKNKGHLVDLCLRRAGAVYDNVIEIPKSSRVRIYDRDVQVIRLDWPRREAEESLERISYYMEQALQDLQDLKQQGKNDDEINRAMEIKLRTRNLLEQIAPLENCRVTVYKPRKESMIRQGKPEYAPWDEVPKWSGGEEYSVYVTMFMIMLTHIRQQTEGRGNVWKVLLADNPFGKASSPHVWEPVFQIARANRIQLICLTAHKQEDILKRFPVVYSLQLRSAYGREIMSAEAMESGFYRLDAASSEGAQIALRF